MLQHLQKCNRAGEAVPNKFIFNKNMTENKNWYAVYTKSRAEKKLFQLLSGKNIDSFLPLKKELRQRSDRKKWIETPLLSSYLFVHISHQEYFDVLNTPGAVKYVSFEGKAVPIPDEQIATLKRFTQNEPEDLQVYYGHLDPGEYVEVVSGPLRGIKGEVLEMRGKYRILLRFDTLGCCVHAEVAANGIVSSRPKTSAVFENH